MKYDLPLSLSSVPTQSASWFVDYKLLMPVLALLSLGLVMVASSSFSYAEHNFKDPFHFVKRHAVYLLLASVVMCVCFFTPSQFWKTYTRLWILLAALLLSAVLIPGVGKTVNGSTRWLSLGGFTVQVSEFMKLAMIVFMAAYLESSREKLRENWREVGKPLSVLMFFAVLLILQPDLGSVVVLTGTVMLLLFLGGAKLWQFLLLIGLGGVSLYWLIGSSEYRQQRITAFLDPWANQFDSGYQLTQSLIAFGRGEWFGAGLGQSVQKLLYLPEAHTDFVFAIYAEEFGFIGVSVLIALFVCLVVRILSLAKTALRQEVWFSAFMLFGIGAMISGQAFINLGVNSGLLPTKGLTLPFISYGGSSLIVCCAMAGIMLRISHDLELGPENTSPKGKVISGRLAVKDGRDERVKRF